MFFGRSKKSFENLASYPQVKIPLRDSFAAAWAWSMVVSNTGSCVSFCWMRRPISVHPRITPRAPLFDRFSMMRRNSLREAVWILPWQSSMWLLKKRGIRWSRWRYRDSQGINCGGCPASKIKSNGNRICKKRRRYNSF